MISSSTFQKEQPEIMCIHVRGVNCKQLFLVFPDRVYNKQQNVLFTLQKETNIL